jgi:RNA polymerase sigma-70 factor (ECF subfamily)
MVQSARGESLSRYHLEGAIVAEHCLCSSFQAINWGRIVELYDLLVGMLPGPIHLLNRAVAVARWKGPDAGLQELARLDSDKSLRNYYLWNAVLGELNRQAGNLSEAGHYLSLAFEQCPSIAERKLISSRLDGILDNSRVGIFLK